MNKKLFSKTAILCYVFIFSFIYFISSPYFNRLFLYEAAQIRDSLYKKYIEDDSHRISNEEIDTVKIIINNEALEAIEKTRKNVLKNYFKTGIQNIKKHPYHKVIAKYKNYKAPVSIKLFGMNMDHYHKSKLSFRIKSKGGRFFAKKSKNILSPKTRSFQMDHIFNENYNTHFGGIGIKQTPIFLKINNKSYGIYFMEDFFDKYLIEKNKKKESFIFESALNNKFQGSKQISQLNTDEAYFNINTLPKGKKWKNLSKRVINLFHNNSPNKLFSIIDAEKLNAVIGLCLFSQDAHPLLDINLHWYYNPVNNKLEPLIRESYIKEIDPNYSIEDIWNKFYSKIVANPGLQLIEEWIEYQEMNNSKLLISQSALKSALQIQKYLKSNSYKSFISKINPEFYFNTSKKEKTIISNITQLKSKIDLIEDNPIAIDSSIIINSNLTIKKDFIVDKNIELIIKQGAQITLEKNANLYIFGKIKCLGEASNPIKFIGNKNSNSSIYINTSFQGQFNFCEFIGLSALNNNLKLPLYKDFWETTSAITLYQSKNISFSNCLFTNNKNGDDMINVVNCENINFKKSKFKNIMFDALDSDFSSIKIANCKFLSCGNDAIDVSESKVNINNCFFEKIADKAISIGEKSHVEVLDCEIKYSEIALVIKDGSYLEATNIILENNRLDLVAFSKKEEYDSPSFKLLNCDITNYLIDEKVKNIGLVDYYRTDQLIKDILYGIKYGTATNK